MFNLGDIARHWSKRTEQGKGLRLDAAQLNQLNAIGVGALIHAAVAKEQQLLCEKRISPSTSEGATGLSMTEAEADRSVRRSSRSSGMIPQQAATAAAQRVQRILQKQNGS